MARQFASVNSEYFLSPATFSIAMPFTMGCWFNWNNTGGRTALMSIGDISSNTHYWHMEVENSLENLSVSSRAGSFVQATLTSNNTTQNTWHYGAATYVSTTERNVFLNGSATTAQDTTSSNPLNIDTVVIGSTADFSPDNPMQGRIAEAGIWDVELTNIEIDMLAAGLSPLLVRPQNLVFYAPLHKASGDEFDVVGGLTLTDTATVTHGDHPPGIIYPYKRIIQFPIVAAPGSPPPEEEPGEIRALLGLSTTLLTDGLPTFWRAFSAPPASSTAPTILEVNGYSLTITLPISNETDHDHWQVFTSTDDVFYTLANDDVSTSTYEIENLTHSTTYYIKVKDVDSFNNVGEFSPSVSELTSFAVYPIDKDGLFEGLESTITNTVARWIITDENFLGGSFYYEDGGSWSFTAPSPITTGVADFTYRVLDYKSDGEAAEGVKQVNIL